MRPPIAPAISVSPSRLLGAALLLGAVCLLALALLRGRGRGLPRLSVDEPLSRLRGFHIFGPEEDEEPRVHVPVLLARPVPPAARPSAPPPPSAAARAAAAPPQPPAAAAPGPAPAMAAASLLMPAREERAPQPAPRRPAATSVTAVATKPVTRVEWTTAKAAEPRPQAEARPAARSRSRAATPKAVAVNGHDRQGSTPPPPPSPERHVELSANPQRLPLNRPPSAGPGPLEADEELTGGRDILLVEDDATIAGMYAMLLQSRGYTSRHARDGVEGIAMVREERPALILLDMMMPRMDGLQFLEALRGWPKTQDIPVVILSNVGDRPLVEKAMALGAVEYLVKAQTRPQVLIGALPHWLRGNRALTTLA